MGRKKKNIIDVITDFNKKHGNFYDYSLIDYKNSNSKLNILCPIHGSFWQTSNNHSQGQGCPKCRSNNKKTLAETINDFKKVHGNRYDYSKVNYINTTKKVEVICKIKNHKSFLVTPNNHKKGSGCPLCNNSKGETLILTFLEDNNILFKKEYTFSNLPRKRFDFFLEELNLCIEFDGKQHFEPIEHFGGKETFNWLKRSDNLKNQFCKDNNIKLLRISYLEINKIKEILKGNIC